MSGFAEEEMRKEDFGTLCICALRYCQGRRTYMPSLVISIVSEHLSEFSDKDIAVMWNDCEYQKRYDLYGDDCDRVEWMKWKARLDKEKEKRNMR